MPYRKIFFEENQPYHIISRAVDERKIFEQEEDCLRFIFQIFAANVGKPAFNLWKKDVVKVARALLNGEEPSSKFIIREHSPFVYFLDFSLVKNHYHFYLVPGPGMEKSVPLFVKKLNGGFAMHFNLKYKRKGSLFGGRYKSIPVETEFQSNAVSRYVSIINPLDVYQPGWREKGLKDWEDALKFLENYPFSSFPDKIGKRNSKIIAPAEILQKYCSLNTITENEYRQFVKDFLKQRLSSFQPLFLE